MVYLTVIVGGLAAGAYSGDHGPGGRPSVGERRFLVVTHCASRDCAILTRDVVQRDGRSVVNVVVVFVLVLVVQHDVAGLEDLTEVRVGQVARNLIELVLVAHLVVQRDVVLGVLAGKDPHLLRVVRQVREDGEQQLGADAMALKVRGNGEAADRGLVAFDADTNGPHQAVAAPRTERDDVGRLEVGLEFFERLRESREVGVVVELRLSDESRASQGQQFADVFDADAVNSEFFLPGHRSIVSGFRPLADYPEIVFTRADSTGTAWVLSLSCPDGPGIVHAVSGALAEHGGNITESQQFGDPDTGLFFMRVEVTSPAPRIELEAAIETLAVAFGMTWKLDVVGRRMRTLVLVSTAAHCVNDLLFREREGTLPVDIVGVAGNHENLRDLVAFYGKSFTHIPVTVATKPEAEARLLRLVDEADVELVVLARYMQILSPELCTALTGRAINIHHSFLPSFKGARPYVQAHDRGVKLIGATAHYVTSDLDEGPIIEQDVERVDHTFTPEAMAATGADLERRALSRAVRWHAEHRVLLNGKRTIVFR